MICCQCKKCGECGKPYSSNSTYAEICKDFEKKKMTNFEKIKSMSVDEMAECILDEFRIACDNCECRNNYNDCKFCIQSYLKSEVVE